MASPRRSSTPGTPRPLPQTYAEWLLAAAPSGPGALLDLLAIPGLQLADRVFELEKKLAEMTRERDVLERVLTKKMEAAT